MALTRHWLEPGEGCHCSKNQRNNPNNPLSERSHHSSSSSSSNNPNNPSNPSQQLVNDTNSLQIRETDSSSNPDNLDNPGRGGEGNAPGHTERKDTYKETERFRCSVKHTGNTASSGQKGYLDYYHCARCGRANVYRRDKVEWRLVLRVIRAIRVIIVIYIREKHSVYVYVCVREQICIYILMYYFIAHNSPNSPNNPRCVRHIYVCYRFICFTPLIKARWDLCTGAHSHPVPVLACLDDWY